MLKRISKTVNKIEMVVVEEIEKSESENLNCDLLRTLQSYILIYAYVDTYTGGKKKGLL